jgi:hypothetical protein
VETTESGQGADANGKRKRTEKGKGKQRALDDGHASGSDARSDDDGGTTGDDESTAGGSTQAFHERYMGVEDEHRPRDMYKAFDGTALMAIGRHDGLFSCSWFAYL